MLGLPGDRVPFYPVTVYDESYAIISVVLRKTDAGRKTTVTDYFRLRKSAVFRSTEKEGRKSAGKQSKYAEIAEQK